METLELLEKISNGEDSYTQFKEDITNNDKLAYELMAFSNARGGVLIIGIADRTGNIIGLSVADIGRLNQMIGSVIRDKIKPLIYPIVTIKNISGNKILVIEVSEGISKPYDVNGVYYTKAGSDKRIISQEELRRLFAESKKLYADEEIVNGTNITDLNQQLFDIYLEKANKNIFSKLKKGELNLATILENQMIMKNNQLTLAGNLIFGIKPQQLNPSFFINCCYFNGNDTSVNRFISKQRIKGTFEKLYDDSLRFITSNLQNKQVEENFNSNGVPEISHEIIGELLVNALIHRDYYINSSIKIFIFHNRLEIISPGKLTNSLTIENIKNGRSICRNPILDSICENILPYSGYGSGIKRVLSINPDVEFINDINKEEFKCIIPR